MNNNPYYGTGPSGGEAPPPPRQSQQYAHQTAMAPPMYQMQEPQMTHPQTFAPTLGQPVDAIDPELDGGSKYRDLIWAILFYLSVIANIAGMVYALRNQECVGESCFREFKPQKLKFDLIAASLGVGGLFTLFWLFVITHCASAIIKLSLMLVPISFIVAAVGGFGSGQPVVGGIMLVFALLMAFYAFWVWKRIPFATVCLGIAATTFKKFKAPLFVSFFTTMIGLVMLVVDMMALMAIQKLTRQDDEAYHEGRVNAMFGFLAFLWLIGLYWHMMVAMNVAHTTSCGVMASWFFGQETSGVTMGSFIRATTTSFGSICFGSLLTAIVRALQFVVRMLKDQERDNGNAGVAIVLALLECLIDILGDILEYFNDYVYVQIATYGKSYIRSAKDTLQLFRTTGMTAIINDDLTHLPLKVGGFLCALVMGSTMAGFQMMVRNRKMTELDRDISSMTISMVFGLFVYFGTVSVISSYIKTLFVCWAEKPAEFSLNRPQACEKMVVAARKAGHSTTFCRIGSV